MQPLVLFYSPGACSLAIHASLIHAGAAFEAVRVDLRTGIQREADYLRLNPQGRVPTLAVGTSPLMEVVAIADYLHQRFPGAGLLPSAPLDRAKDLAAILRLATDVHPLYRALWIPGWFLGESGQHDVLQDGARRRLLDFYAELEISLAQGRWGHGPPTGFLAFYTGVFLRWSAAVAPGGLGPCSEALRARLVSDPAMSRALAVEGIRLDSLKRLSD